VSGKLRHTRPNAQFACTAARNVGASPRQGTSMNTIIYIVGAIVIIGAVLSYFGLR